MVAYWVLPNPPASIPSKLNSLYLSITLDPLTSSLVVLIHLTYFLLMALIVLSAYNLWIQIVTLLTSRFSVLWTAVSQWYRTCLVWNNTEIICTNMNPWLLTGRQGWAWCAKQYLSDSTIHSPISFTAASSIFGFWEWGEWRQWSGNSINYSGCPLANNDLMFAGAFPLISVE